MPELPEVEACRRDLVRWTTGRRIARIDAPDPASIRSRLSTNPADALPQGIRKLRRLQGATTIDVLRHGKRLGWRLDRGALLLHLGMTGQWLLRRDEPPTARVRLVIGLDDGSTLWF